jgi:hypothetical protein
MRRAARTETRTLPAYCRQIRKAAASNRCGLFLCAPANRSANARDLAHIAVVALLSDYNSLLQYLVPARKKDKNYADDDVLLFRLFRPYTKIN